MGEEEENGGLDWAGKGRGGEDVVGEVVGKM